MTERPIIFSGPMVRAILERRKTQTRRVLSEQNPIDLGAATNGTHLSKRRVYRGGKLVGNRLAVAKCPYGKPGDRLWVRETFNPAYTRSGKDSCCIYKADYGWRKDLIGEYEPANGWKPSIHMPRWASRITLEILKIRVERVQKISESDALAEGCQPETVTAEDVANLQISDVSPEIKKLGAILGPGQFTAKHSFSGLWDSINANRKAGEYVWAKNPWVWVIEFKRLESNQ